MNWVVVVRGPLNEWLATDPDPDLVVEVLVWLDALPNVGPPIDGVFDPSRETYGVEIGSVRAEYAVFPYLADPAIVIYRFS